MYKLPNFNKTFTGVLLVGLLLAIYSFFSSYLGWNSYKPGVTPSLGSLFLSFLPYLIMKTIFWISLGYLFEERRAGLIAAAVFFITAMGSWYSFRFYPGNTTPIVMVVLKQVFIFLPYLVFGALTLKDKRMWWFLLVGLIGNTLFLFGYGHGLSDFLNRSFRLLFNIRDAFEIHIPTDKSGYRVIYPLSTIMKTLQLPIWFLVASQVFYSLKNNHKFLGGRTIDLSNTFSKRKATLIYFIFRFGLYAFAANAFFYFSNNSLPQKGIFQQSIFGISFICTLYLISLTYRNFLTEYSFSRGKTPGFMYFMWNIPFINIFAWLVSLVIYKKTIPALDRKKLLKEGRWEKNNGIKVFFIIFLGLIFLTKLNSIDFRIDGQSSTAAWTYLLAGVVSLGILMWYLSHPFGIYVIVGLATFLLLSDAFIGSVIPTSRRAGGGYYTNISNAIIYFSLFHLAFLRDVGLGEDLVVARVGSVEEEE